MIKVLLVASEGLPYIKSGGLADVIASLPVALSQQGIKVCVVLPMYRKIRENHPELKKVTEYDVHSGIINKRAEVYSGKIGKVTYYFIAQDDYFNRDAMYGYNDDGERFAFYCKAVCDMLLHIPFKPDVIHTNDWHTGMIPIMCKKEYDNEQYRKYKHVYTIHNLLFQGNFSKDTLSCFNNMGPYYDNGDIKFDQGISFMKAGIVYADKITTVSEQYAKEIMTPEFGERLESVLEYRKQNLCGIVNGIDIESWNPETDPDIYQNYSLTKLEGKKECKKSLQYQLGLRVADDVMLIGIVSRLTWQKGMHLILEKLQQIMNQDVQFIILGTGDGYIEGELKKIESTYPRRAVFYCGYNEQLSHRVYAGCDMLLMPSLFEPCGISQLIAMRYGTIPLVRETGGLKDTVTPYNQYDSTGNGFSFRYFKSDEMIYILVYAITVYYEKKAEWNRLVQNAMTTDVSWLKSAGKYKELYKSII
ncbi:MAG: glycogen synthase GlgA [Erysipelotrichaceae bacterium]|nr:glycogen synthase GlgA [Erysipelotrichaceae bacterium]